MKLSLDRAFRIVWLVVGGLLLLFLLVGGVLVAAQWIGNAGADNAAVRVVGEAQPARDESRAVRYGATVPLRGTSTRLVFIRYGESYDGPAYARSEGRADDAWVNVIFLDGGGARLLVDRSAYIRQVRAPTVEASLDSMQTWITYLMALDDTDRNGKLDHRDQVGLYVTDVEGRNLRPALRPPLRYASHQAMEGGRMLVYAFEPPSGQQVDEKRMLQRAFIYDVASGTLAPYTALDSAVARAARIVAR
ncbi:MAG TPA: hypothetical protein VK358_18400 [Longimicrobium sp.]|nr:hypothetical protein [Longimicrobium sp.]